MDPSAAFLEHFNKGVALYKAGQADAAIIELRAAISLNPNVVQAHGNLAAVLTDRGRHDEAIAELEAALRIDPKHAPSLYSLGRYFEERDRAPEALAVFKAFLACAGPQQERFIPDARKRLASLEEKGAAEAPFRAHLARAEQLASAGEHAQAYQELMKARGVPGRERAVEALELQSRLALKGRRQRLRAVWRRSSLPGAVQADALGFSPDGGRLASGHRDGAVRLWRAPQWREPAALTGHAGPVTAVCWTPDGKAVVSASADGSLRLWDAGKGDSLRPFLGHAGPVHAVCLTPDGKHTLSAGEDGSLMLWEVATAQRLKVLAGHDRPVLCAALTPDGRHAFSGGADGALKAWDLASGQALRSTAAHGGAVRAVRVTPDGRRVITAGDDGLLREWDLESGACREDWSGHSGPLLSACLSPHGRFVLLACGDKGLRTWDTATGALAVAAQEQGGRVLRVALSPDGRFVSCAGEDGVVELRELDWDYEFPAPRPWDEGARPVLSAFLAGGETDFSRLLEELGRRGYGWLGRDGVKGKFGEMNGVPAWGPTPSAAKEQPRAAAPRTARPLKRLLGEAYGLWWRGRPVFAGIAVACVALDLVLFAALLSAPNPGLRFCVRFLEKLLPAAAMFVAVVAADMFDRGLRPSAAEVVSELEPGFLRSLGVVLVWLGGSVLGLFFLVVPGVRVYVRLFFAPYAVLIDGYGGRAAIERSWRLMQGRELSVLGSILAFSAVTFLCVLPLQAAGVVLLEGVLGAAGASPVVVGASGAVWGLFAQVFGQAYMLSGLVLLYRDLAALCPDPDAP